MNDKVIRVVIDTSVLIHYLIRPGAVIRRIIEGLWINEDLVMVSSPELFEELDDVLGREDLWRYIHPEDKEALLVAIRAMAEFIPDLGEIPTYTRDPKDDKFIACAIAGDASFLITLDRDILVLGKLGEVQMITPYDFLQSLSE